MQNLSSTYTGLIDPSAPRKLKAALGGQQPLFIVKGKGKPAISRGIAGIIFGLIWTGAILSIASPFLLEAEINEIHTLEALKSILNDLLFLMLFYALFFIIGVTKIIQGIIAIFSTKIWYAGTSNKLISFNKKVVDSANWNQFDQNILLEGSPDDGSIILTLKGSTGKQFQLNQVKSPGQIIEICRAQIRKSQSSKQKLV